MKDQMKKARETASYSVFVWGEGINERKEEPGRKKEETAIVEP